jgi:hypothetical protein
MTTCIIAHSTVPSTRISRELALTIGASPSPLTVTRPHAEVVVVLNIVGHVSKGLAKVGKAIVRQRIIYFKSCYIKTLFLVVRYRYYMHCSGTRS